jgi:hypothetical protein
MVKYPCVFSDSSRSLTSGRSAGPGRTGMARAGTYAADDGVGGEGIVYGDGEEPRGDGLRSGSRRAARFARSQCGTIDDAAVAAILILQ